MKVYDVILVRLEDGGRDPVELVETLRKAFGVDEAQARRYLQNLPQTLRRSVPLETAQEYQRKLRAAGAEVEIDESVARTPTRRSRRDQTVADRVRSLGGSSAVPRLGVREEDDDPTAVTQQDEGDVTSRTLVGAAFDPTAFDDTDQGPNAGEVAETEFGSSPALEQPREDEALAETEVPESTEDGQPVPSAAGSDPDEDVVDEALAETADAAAPDIDVKRATVGTGGTMFGLPALRASGVLPALDDDAFGQGEPTAAAEEPEGDQAEAGSRRKRHTTPGMSAVGSTDDAAPEDGEEDLPFPHAGGPREDSDEPGDEMGKTLFGVAALSEADTSTEEPSSDSRSADVDAATKPGQTMFGLAALGSDADGEDVRRREPTPAPGVVVAASDEAGEEAEPGEADEAASGTVLGAIPAVGSEASPSPDEPSTGETMMGAIPGIAAPVGAGDDEREDEADPELSGRTMMGAIPGLQDDDDLDDEVANAQTLFGVNKSPLGADDIDTLLADVDDDEPSSELPAWEFDTMTADVPDFGATSDEPGRERPSASPRPSPAEPTPASGDLPPPRPSEAAVRRQKEEEQQEKTLLGAAGFSEAETPALKELGTDEIEALKATSYAMRPSDHPEIADENPPLPGEGPEVVGLEETFHTASTPGSPRAGFWDTLGQSLVAPLRGDGWKWMVSGAALMAVVALVATYAPLMPVLGLLVGFFVVSALLAVLSQFFDASFHGALDEAFSPSRGPGVTDLAEELVYPALSFGGLWWLLEMAVLLWALDRTQQGFPIEDVALHPLAWLLFLGPFVYWPAGLGAASTAGTTSAAWNVFAALRAIARAPAAYFAVVLLGVVAFAVPLAIYATLLSTISVGVWFPIVLAPVVVGVPLAYSHGLQGALMGSIVRETPELYV